ncbi:MAG: hypothetical protein Q8L86_10245 [Vicinamibacterales bacterium]|nr:hypothetical protein [Vicinamibacterales bacterium]
MRAVRVLSFVVGAATILLTAAAEAQPKPTTTVVAQHDAPVTISSYTAQYRERSQYAAEGVHHSVKYQNSSGRTIVAIQFGLATFDVWNEFLNRTNGIALETVTGGRSQSGTWIANPLRAFTFLTGVAWVSKVRFEDGEIWTADEKTVLEALRAIEADFDAARLKPEPPPGG